MSADVPLRVAVIGARCRRQGIGAHLARFCAEAGAEVVAVLGTTPDTAGEAAEILRASTGQAPHACTEMEDLLARARPDTLVVASPNETHAGYLRQALGARLHVLCEKPLVWPRPRVEDSGDDDLFQTLMAGEDLAERYLTEGLHLRVNAQWPFTLDTYAGLCPDPRTVTPQRFRMRLSPRSRGLAMLPDALPHPLSLLAAVLPDEDALIENVAVRFGAAGTRSEIRFTYRTWSAAVAVQVELQQCVEQPRPAGYGFDGHFVQRHVELPGYRMSFESETERIPLPDPTPLLVRSFLDDVSAGAPPGEDRAVIPGLRHLVQIVAAAPAP
jgi:hypothetical protein